MPTAATRRAARRRARQHDARADATYARFLDDLIASTGWSTPDAERYASAVVATLEERLVAGESEDLAAQLPLRLREHVDDEDVGKPDPDMTGDELLGRVAARADVPFDEVDAIVRVVFGTLRRHISPGLAHHVEVQLSDDLRRLWNPPSFGRR